MHYDIQLGFLAVDAIREFSKASNADGAQRYDTFLERTAQYCRALRNAYGHPAEADIPAAVQGPLAEFMRTVVRAHQPPPAVTAKLKAVGSLEGFLDAIRNEQRIPSDEECLGIAQTIYATSAADPR
jgi:hypothetical protein